jgi:hypothetical protein
MHRALILIENHKLLPMGLIYIIFFVPLKLSSFLSFPMQRQKKAFHATPLGAQRKKDKSN